MTLVDPHFVKALATPPDKRTLQDLHIIYYGLQALEPLSRYREKSLRSLCKSVRFERHNSNDILFYTGELSTCWYILLSGSVYIDGTMFLPMSSFGTRTGGTARRAHECFVLEPSAMIVIDYPEGGVGGGGRGRCDMKPAVPSFDQTDNNSHNNQYIGVYGGTKCGTNRSSQSSTSSAYSGSDTMTCVDAEEIDLSGLVESIVDSDEEDLADSTESVAAVRDTVRECLEKDPTERTDEDIEILLEFTQHLKAFTNMTLPVRRALCSVMVFAVVEKANTIVMNDGEELDSWSVLINGHVEIEYPDKPPEQLHMGDSFGILPTMEKLYHRGVMRTKCDDCQFVCITQTDYYHIQSQGKENMQRHVDANTGTVVMVTELRTIDSRRTHVLIRGTPDVLINQLIQENSVTDPSYIEDFLLMHRTFIDSSVLVLKQLLKWFEEEDARDRVTRVIILWVNNHYSDFECSREMMEYLELFEGWLEQRKLLGQLRLLNIACAAKARPRCITLARPSREDVLPFSILGGLERGYPIFISKVEKGTKAEDVGLKRADQILEVNGNNFSQICHAKALEILRSTTHLCITVKSNFLGFKDMLESASNNKSKGGVRRPMDPPLPPPLPPPPQPLPSPLKQNKGFMTYATKKNIHKALVKMNIIHKSTSNDNGDDSINGGRDSTDQGSNPSQFSNYEDHRVSDYPEHVLKVYKPDQSYKYLLVHKETSAHEVVMLALQEFGMSEPSWHFSLCEVSVSEGGIIKNKRLPDQLQNLAERIGLNSRYYLKTNGVSETLVTDELASDMMRESVTHFLQLNASEVAIQLTLQDFSVFKQIESTEYIDDLFNIESQYSTPSLSQFQELVNREMFWVITEVCSESNVVRRAKIIKQFIKVARQCKECKNFNSMFAIISGLGHGAVSRLKSTWDKVPNKYLRLYKDLQQFMDPSRNMSKYRQLLNSATPPMIPFFPIIKKDLTFIHLGNDTKVDGLINFEKLRMIAKEIRTLTNMCSCPYDLLTMLELGGQPPSNAIVSMNQLIQPGTGTVKRRKKSMGTPNPRKMFEEAQMIRRVKTYLKNMKVICDEEALLALSQECEGGSGGGGGSGSSGGSGSAGVSRRRNPSPTLSTASSASSASDHTQRKQHPKFGSASPQAVRKLLSLSEGSKPLRVSSAGGGPRLSPGGVRRGGGGGGSLTGGGSTTTGSRTHHHERSHSDTPPPHPPPIPSHHHHHLNHPPPSTLPAHQSVHLSAESSSVTSLSNLPLRKTITTGSVTSSDSGHSTALDSNSSAETPLCPPSTSPPPFHMRRHSAMHPSQGRPPFMHAVPVLPPLPLGLGGSTRVYNVASRQFRLGRAHSHEGVTHSYFQQQQQPTSHLSMASSNDATGNEDDEDESQISAV